MNDTNKDLKEIAVTTDTEAPAEEPSQEIAEVTLDSKQKVSDVITNLGEPVEFTIEDKEFLLDLDNQKSNIKKRENTERLLNLIRGKAPEDKFAPTMEKLEQYTKQFLANNQQKSTDFYLPSYAIWRLFKQGSLETYGISDEAFAREFSCNQFDFCPNFVHAYKDKDGKLLIKGWFKKDDFSAMDLPEELVKAIKQEMEKISEEISS